MSWHSEDWLGLMFSFMRWILVVFSEAAAHEAQNGGGPLTDAKNGNWKPPVDQA